MSSDSKTHQAIDASLPRKDEPYCPECVQSLTAHAPLPFPRPARSTSWSWLLIITGLYLVVSFAPRVWRTHQAEAEPARALPSQTACPAEMVGRQVCLPDIPGGSARAMASQASHELTQSQLGHDPLALATGLLVVVVGLGALVRWRLQQDSQIRSPRLLVFLWSTGEAVSCMLIGPALAVNGWLILTQLAAGRDVSWSLLESTTDQTIALVIAITQFAASYLAMAGSANPA